MKTIFITIVVLLSSIAVHSSSFANTECEDKKEYSPSAAINLINQGFAILPEVPSKEAAYIQQEYEASGHSKERDGQRFVALRKRPYYYVWMLTENLKEARDSFEKIMGATATATESEKIHLATQTIHHVIQVKTAYDDFQNHDCLNENTPKFLNGEYLSRLFFHTSRGSSKVPIYL